MLYKIQYDRSYSKTSHVLTYITQTIAALLVRHNKSELS